MRSKFPRLVLQGDTRKAKSWIPWATKWLERTKKALGEAVPINRSAWVVTPRISNGYQKGGGVLVHVGSVIGVDTIRIFAQQVIVGCKASASFTWSATGLTADFTGSLSGDANNIFYDFGDGQYSKDSLSPSHTYKEAGSYTVSITGYKQDISESTPQQQITFSHISRDDGASLISHADSYSKWTGLSWLPGGDRSQFLASHGAGVWRTFGKVLTATVPLQDIAAYTAVQQGRAIIYVTGRWTTYIVIGATPNPIVKKISGSDMGFDLRLDNNTPHDNIAGLIDPAIPMVESVVEFVDASDVEPWTILPDDPQVFGSNVGWTGLAPFPPAGNKLVVRPYECKGTTTEIVTVA